MGLTDQHISCRGSSASISGYFRLTVCLDGFNVLFAGGILLSCLGPETNTRVINSVHLSRILEPVCSSGLKR